MSVPPLVDIYIKGDIHSQTQCSTGIGYRHLRYIERDGICYTMCMDNTQQRERIHTTVSKEVSERMDLIRKREGISSTSALLEWFVMNDSIGQRIDKLIGAIEGTNVHKQHTPDGDKPKIKTVNTWCSKFCSKEKQNCVATKYTDSNGNAKEEFLCKKHYLELLEFKKDNGGDIEVL